MSEKSNEEINKLITEKLFQTCFHNYEGDYCLGCDDYSPFYARLKNKDFCNSDANIREAREKIVEKGLEKDFGAALLKELTDAGIGWSAFSIVHAGTDLQARAICRVLENL